MSALFFASLAAQGLQQHGQQAASAELAERQNQEALIAADNKQATISANISAARDSYTKSVANSDINQMKARSDAIVAAAAAGTAGLSVDDSILNIERNAARAEGTAQDNLSLTIANLERSRLGVEAEYRNRLSPVNRPDALGIALGIGADAGLATKGKLWDFGSAKLPADNPNLGFMI